METEESVVQVDAGARTDAVRTKIEQMRQIGYDLVGAVPDLPEGGHIATEMKLVFRHHTFAKIGNGTYTPSPGETLLHSGPGEITVPGDDLDI
jgi:hypothetical protein